MFDWGELTASWAVRWCANRSGERENRLNLLGESRSWDWTDNESPFAVCAKIKYTSSLHSINFQDNCTIMKLNVPPLSCWMFMMYSHKCYFLISVLLIINWSITILVQKGNNNILLLWLHSIICGSTINMTDMHTQTRHGQHLQ